MNNQENDHIIQIESPGIKGEAISLVMPGDGG